MDIAIIANGFLPEHPHLREEILACRKKIAVDGGMHHLDKMGIIPDLWIGDFDSASADLEQKYHHIPRKIFSVDKDLSDTELAIQEALHFTPTRIFLFAGLGSRLDHSLSNLLLLGKYTDILYLVSESEISFAFTKNLLLSSTPGQRFSFLPLFGPVKVTKSEGLRWPLSKMTLSYHQISLSNEAISPRIEVKLSKGILLCTTPFIGG